MSVFVLCHQFTSWHILWKYGQDLEPRLSVVIDGARLVSHALIFLLSSDELCSAVQLFAYFIIYKYIHLYICIYDNALMFSYFVSFIELNCALLLVRQTISYARCLAGSIIVVSLHCLMRNL